FAGTQNPGPSWHVVGTGDTDGDFRAGILWQNNDGTLALWKNADLTFLDTGIFSFDTVAVLPTVDPSWHVKGMADLNADFREDIVFQNDNGSVAVWEMDGTTVSAVSLVNRNPGPSWHIVGLRNMDGDAEGRADILFQHDNGATAVWTDYRSLGGGSAATFDSRFLI